MTDKSAVYRIVNDKPSLVGKFEQVFQRVVASDFSCEAAHTLTAFAMSLLGDVEFDLSKLNDLAKADQDLALNLLEFCMSEGLTEDERSVASAAFALYGNPKTGSQALRVNCNGFLNVKKKGMVLK